LHSFLREPLPLPLPLPLPFCLSFPKGIRFCPCRCLCFCRSVCHSRRESAFALPLPLLLLFCLSFPKGIRFCPCRCLCFCFSVCHSRRESAFALAVAFLSVIPEGNPLLPLPLPFCLSFPKGICFCPVINAHQTRNRRPPARTGLTRAKGPLDTSPGHRPGSAPQQTPPGLKSRSTNPAP